MGRPAHDVVTRLCPAKVNLALSVGPPTPPRGYHPIASWMIALAWGDALTLRRAAVRCDGLQLERFFAADAPQPQAIDWPVEKDLAWRAHALLERHAGRSLPAVARLEKRIPAGAGLGGGSSNAAAMLLAIDELFDLRFGVDQLADLSTELGSDVPFLVRAAGAGEASCIVTGFGERIEPAPLAATIHLVLFLPDACCPTAAVYAVFDEAGASELDEAAVRRLAAHGRHDGSGLFNDLFKPAVRVAPRLEEIHARLSLALELPEPVAPVHLTGSGAAMFAVVPSAVLAEEVAQRATRDCGVPAIATRTLG